MYNAKNDSRFYPIIVGLVLVAVLFIPSFQSSNLKLKTKGPPANWTNDINLTNITYSDKDPSLAVWNKTIHVTWESRRESNTREIYYMASDDEGENWNDAFKISNSNVLALNSDVAVKDNYVHIVWDDRKEPSAEIYYRNSEDDGLNWNNEKRISVNDGNNSEGPEVAVNGPNIHVIWVDLRFNPAQTEVYYKRSTDNGINWDDALGNPNQDRRLTHDLSGATSINIDIDGPNIHVIFSDQRDGSYDVYYIRSTDNGVTWDDGLGNINEERKITSDSNNHGPGAIAVSGSTIHVAWIDQVWPGPVYYIYYRKSLNNGVTWEPIQLLSGPSPIVAMLNLAVMGSNIYAVWDDGRDGDYREIYYKNSTNGGNSWNGDIRLTYNQSQHSSWPKIALNHSTVHVTWYDGRDGNFEIYYKRSPDIPTDTTPPNHSNEIPLPGSYKDAPGTNISIHVTDSSGVNDSSIQLMVNGSLVSHTLSSITDGYNVSWASTGFDPGIVECRIIAEDLLGNSLDFTWNFTVLATYDILLQEGWNLISVPFEQVEITIDEVLNDIAGKWDYIRIYDTLAESWKSNATFRPVSLNDFDALTCKMGFWINITEPSVTLTVRGNITSSTDIPLYAGWNLVGYPSLNTETVANSLWGTGADKVEKFDVMAPYRINEVAPSYVMKPGEGYWVHVPADSVWIIDW